MGGVDRGTNWKKNYTPNHLPTCQSPLRRDPAGELFRKFLHNQGQGWLLLKNSNTLLNGKEVLSYLLEWDGHLVSDINRN